MRLTNLDVYTNTRNRLARRASIFWGVVFGTGVFLLLLIGGEFLVGLLVGVVVGAAMFLTTSSLRRMVVRGQDKRYAKMVISEPHCEVLIGREVGVLQLRKDMLLYNTITPGANDKKREIPINENLFISVNVLKKSFIEKKLYGDVVMGAITMKDMPHGVINQFTFWDIDGLMSKIEERVNEIDQYIHKE